jgi:hypothetical protein
VCLNTIVNTRSGELTVAASMADGGGRGVHVCAKGTTTFIGEHKAVGSFLARQGNHVAAGSRHGRSTAEGATTCGVRPPMAQGGSRRPADGRAPRGLARDHRRHGHAPRSAAHGPLGAGWPRRACTTRYGGRPTGRARRGTRTGSRCVPVLHNSA